MIRLSRIGKKKHPFYRVVVTEKTRPANGRFVEIVGTYDPSKKPASISLKDEQIGRASCRARAEVDAIAIGTRAMARMLRTPLIVTLTSGGFTSRKVAALRTPVP